MHGTLMSMNALRAILLGVGESMTPDGTMVKNRMRITADMLVTMAVMVLAIVLAVGYQVLGRWGNRIFGEQE
jgi:hypothetical protein